MKRTSQIFLFGSSKQSKRSFSSTQSGLTLFEILIVFTIIALIVVFLLIALQTQTKRANDSRRKTDLSKIQKAYEEYFNDKQCYPYAEALTNCNSSELSPYIKRVPCDPVTKTPYLYVTAETNLCIGYRVCAKLENLQDPDIVRIGCDPVSGCGWAPGFNYCLSVGLSAANDGAGLGSGGGGLGGEEGPLTPTPPPGPYACTPGGVCNSYADPIAGGCSFTYNNPNCVFQGIFQCQFQANKCTNY